MDPAAAAYFFLADSATGVARNDNLGFTSLFNLMIKDGIAFEPTNSFSVLTPYLGFLDIYYLSKYRFFSHEWVA
jgi:hypothetical protein